MDEDKTDEEGIPEGIGRAAGCLLILLLFPWLLMLILKYGDWVGSFFH